MDLINSLKKKSECGMGKPASLLCTILLRTTNSNKKVKHTKKRERKQRRNPMCTGVLLTPVPAMEP